MLRRLRLFTVLIAVLLGGSEIARWAGDARFVPLAFDELAVAAALLAAAWAAPRAGPAPLVAAWGLYCGLMLALLVPTLDHLLFGPPKPSALLYSALLGASLAIGGGALVAALRAARNWPDRTSLHGRH